MKICLYLDPESKDDQLKLSGLFPSCLMDEQFASVLVVCAYKC